MRACRSCLPFLLPVIVATAECAQALEFPGPAPGPARASLEDGRLTMHNDVIAATWDLASGRFALVEVVDRLSDAELGGTGTEAFQIRLSDGTKIRSSELRILEGPALEPLQPERDAIRRSLRFGGWKASVAFASQGGRCHGRWEAELRHGSNYVRQRLTLWADTGELAVEEATLVDTNAPAARVVGTVDGSPVLAGNLFVACEHPMASNQVEGGRVLCAAPRYRPLGRGQQWTATAVIGVLPPGQLRRGFLYYLERERARPYQPFVYYISWFDIAAPGRKMREEDCLEVIERFGHELVTKRGIRLDAFVFDDGWDDNRTLWQFHSGFPQGFTPLKQAAGRHGAVLGTWISPWGGYGVARKERLEYGAREGFEQNTRGFSLAGPKYYDRFRAVCIEHMKKYGVRYFKFDGIGPGDVSSGAGRQFGPDVEALLRLIVDLRRERPEVFINTTVGTWPSPYWLWYSDSIWRSGRDVGYHGEGSKRQQWLTYRDMLGYQLRTRRGPWYPLNSLKFQSLIFARLSLAAELTGDTKDLLDDLHMAAGSGTQMQEFFVTPEKMTPELWDAVAETIGWIRESADVLVDTHGIGGDPGRGEVYGYASWSPR